MIMTDSVPSVLCVHVKSTPRGCKVEAFNDQTVPGSQGLLTHRAFWQSAGVAPGHVLGAINGESLIGMSLNQVVSVIVANPQRPLKVLFLVRPQEVAPLAPLVPVPVRTKAEAKALVAADKVAARQAKVDAKARVAAEKLIARQKKAKAKVLEAARKANARQAKQARKPVRTIKVTGTSFRASSVHGAMAAHGEVLAHNRFTTAHRVRLRREPNNLYDRNAVAVDVSGHHVGYIPKTQVRGGGGGRVNKLFNCDKGLF